MLPLGKGARRSRGDRKDIAGPAICAADRGPFQGAARKRRRPRRLTSAPASVDTVAAFRPWRGFRPSVARGRRGHHGLFHSKARFRGGLSITTKLAERGGFEPPKRGLDAYTLSRRAPSTTRTPLRTWSSLP